MQLFWDRFKYCYNELANDKKNVYTLDSQI